MFKCLEIFGFGHRFGQFYGSMSSCIIKNGSLSADFDLSRGVRQGVPLSPYLCIIVVEILAASIRASNEIKGIKLESDEYEKSQAVQRFFQIDVDI